MGYIYLYQENRTENSMIHQQEDSDIYYHESFQQFNQNRISQLDANSKIKKIHPEQTKDNINLDVYFISSHNGEQFDTKYGVHDHDFHVIHKSNVMSCVPTQDENSENEQSDNQSTNKLIIKKIKKQPKGLTTNGKNNAKNFTRALKSFIFSNFTLTQRQKEPFKKFLALKLGNCGKQRLESFLRKKKGNSIGRIFFQNYQWGKEFLETNKVDLQSQMKYNQYWVQFLNNN